MRTVLKRRRFGEGGREGVSKKKRAEFCSLVGPRPRCHDPGSLRPVHRVTTPRCGSSKPFAWITGTCCVCTLTTTSTRGMCVFRTACHMLLSRFSCFGTCNSASAAGLLMWLPAPGVLLNNKPIGASLNVSATRVDGGRDVSQGADSVWVAMYFFQLRLETRAAVSRFCSPFTHWSVSARSQLCSLHYLLPFINR